MDPELCLGTSTGLPHTTLHRRIADVDYVVHIPTGVQIWSPDSVQSAFVSHLPLNEELIQVEIIADRRPEAANWPILFGGDPAWVIRGHHAQRCLCIGKGETDPARSLVICFDCDARRALIYCEPEHCAAGPDGTSRPISVGYPLDQILLMYYLASRQGLLIHAAGLIRAEQALIFPGVSGAGKSTLARQFLAVGETGLLSDDRIIVRRMNGAWQAYGTPWPGDAGVATNASARLKGILFPARGKDLRLQPLDPQVALERLLPATSILWFEPELLTLQLQTCEHLLRQVPAFELAWSPGPAVVAFIADLANQL